MNQVQRLRHHLVERGVLSKPQADAATITLAIGDTPRSRGQMTRRYVVSRGDAPQLSVKFIPRPWAFSLGAILETYTRYSKFSSFRVPRLEGHFETPEGCFFAEEHLRPAPALASLIHAGTVSPQAATDIIKDILAEIWGSGSKPTAAFVRQEKDRYRSYLQRFMRSGLLADVVIEYLERIVTAQQPTLRRVWSAGDIIDRNIVQSGKFWYLVDFEYAHETLFFFKEAFRTILNCEWAHELRLEQICPFLGDFPEPAARLLALAWERQLYSLVLDKHADQVAGQSLRYRFWNIFDAEIAHSSDQQIATARQELADKDEQLHRLQEALQSQAEQLARSSAAPAGAPPLDGELTQVRTAYELTQAHAANLEIETNQLQVQLGTLQAHARNVEVVASRLHENEQRAQGLGRDLTQVREAYELVQAHAANLEIETRQLQIQLSNLQEHTRNLEALTSRLQDAENRARGLDLQLAQARAAHEGTQAHIRNLEAETARLRAVDARAREFETELNSQRQAYETLQTTLHAVEAQGTRFHAEAQDALSQTVALEEVVEVQRVELEQQIAATAQLQELVSAADQERTQWSAAASALKTRIDDQHSELTATNAELERERAARRETGQCLVEREQMIAAVLNSRSWRLTRPLRWIMNPLRRTSEAAPTLASVTDGDSASPRPGESAGAPEPLNYHIEKFRIVDNPFHTSKLFEIGGWCFAPQRRAPVRLELRGDGETLFEITCDGERPDLSAGFKAVYEAGTSSLPLGGIDEVVPVNCTAGRHFALVSPQDDIVLAQGDAEQLADGERAAAAHHPAGASMLSDGLDTGPTSFAGLLRRLRIRARAKITWRAALTPAKWRQWLLRSLEEYRLYRVEWQMIGPAGMLDGTPPARAIEITTRPRIRAAVDGRPVKVACFTHNLNLEGATKVILDAALGLGCRERFAASVISPFDGPARHGVESRGVPCHLLRLPGTDSLITGWKTPADYEKSVALACEYLEAEDPDVVMAMVLNNFYVIEACARLGIPSLWLIQESYPHATMVRSVNAFVLPHVERAFALAHAVIFGSRGTQELYERYNTERNFHVIYNALRPDELEALRAGPSPEEARRRLRAPQGKRVIVSVGTVCTRKDQATLARALGLLAQRRDDFHAYIVGAREGDAYVRMVEQLIRKSAARDCVDVVRETHDVHTYYRAADIFAFSSLSESYPLVILEAMAHGLPIVTTNCIGVSEEVRFGENALLFDFTDADDLANQLDQLLSDDVRRRAMAQRSREIIDGLLTYDEMIDQFEALLLSAVQPTEEASAAALP
jgi:glycosyltransferase involved in cell wall biosynthesis